MTTPTTPDLTAIAERCVSRIANTPYLGNTDPTWKQIVLQALNEATAPLLAEVQRLREVNQVANSLIGNQANENDRIVKQLQSELTTIRADKERVDKLIESRWLDGLFITMQQGRTRQAIDSAIQNEKGKE